NPPHHRPARLLARRSGRPQPRAPARARAERSAPLPQLGPRQSPPLPPRRGPLAAVTTCQPPFTSHQSLPTIHPHGASMRILVINNDGGGFADYIDVEPGLSVTELFGRQVAYGKPRDYLIRVNRQPTPPDQILQEGDRVSFTPT